MNPTLAALHALPAWTVEQRLTFARVALEWTATAKNAELDGLAELREELAPGQVCSLLGVYRLCLSQADLLARWPNQLVRQLQAENLPPA